MWPHRRHALFLASFLGGCLAFAVAFVPFRDVALAVGANVFFFLYVVLVVGSMPRRTADFLGRHAQETDEPPWLIFAVTIAVVGVAVESLFVAIDARQPPHAFWLAFSVGSQPLGWFTIHFAMLHSLLSFFFNTIILAAAVNLVVSLTS